MFFTVIGYLVLVLITLYCLFCTAALLFGSLGMTGKIAGEVYIFVAFSAVLSWVCWYTFPFQFSLTVAGAAG